MPIVYEKLFLLMKTKGITTYTIRKENIIGQATLKRLKSNEPVNTDTIATFCKILNCQPGDILEYKE